MCFDDKWTSCVRKLHFDSKRVEIDPFGSILDLDKATKPKKITIDV